MPMTGQQTPELREVFDSWFAVTVKVLKTKIAKLSIRHSGSLFNSLDYQVPGASEFVNNGYLTFNLYGKFVDMGVGRNFARGNPGRVDTVRRQRIRKEWYSRLFYAQVMRLREIAQQKYAGDAVKQIVLNIEAVNDLKYNAYKSGGGSARRNTLLSGGRPWVPSRTIR